MVTAPLEPSDLRWLPIASRRFWLAWAPSVVPNVDDLDLEDVKSPLIVGLDDSSLKRCLWSLNPRNKYTPCSPTSMMLAQSMSNESATALRRPRSQEAPIMKASFTNKRIRDGDSLVLNSNLCDCDSVFLIVKMV